MSIRFIHAADLHLGSPFKGFTGLSTELLEAVRESTFNAFRTLIRHAVETRPDFMLIAGDIYDGEDRSLKAQEVFRKGMEELASAGIPVFMSHGNHDHLAGRWVRFSLPENVRVFGPEVGTFSLEARGKTVRIHGFSYPERHVTEPVIGDYPEATANDGTIHIGMLHGSIRGDEVHDVYAPFSIGELLSKNYDYWALGHIHKRSLLSEEPPVVYPGNIQGLHRNETGVRGFYEVTIGEGSPALTFIPSSALVFGRVEVPCEGIRHADEWISACLDALQRFHSKNGPGIADLVLTGIAPDDELFSGAPGDEWVAFLREAAADRLPGIGVHRLSFRKEPAVDMPVGLYRDVSHELESWEEAEWKELFSDLYGHRQAYRYVEPADADFIEEVKAEAERLLASGIGKGGTPE
ncbi:exonuclease SbcCD subunit D [Bhargavaea ullalensis]|uniref:DNA repair exonuclease SbcCD nuclease subunit n=1 Tax=Bhargavaea ullalensis TaxID=1265685 RepID=A0ABV2GE43_9BACL